jgi:hypothetical protein
MYIMRRRKRENSSFYIQLIVAVMSDVFFQFIIKMRREHIICLLLQQQEGMGAVKSVASYAVSESKRLVKYTAVGAGAGAAGGVGIAKVLVTVLEKQTQEDLFLKIESQLGPDSKILTISKKIIPYAWSYMISGAKSEVMSHFAFSGIGIGFSGGFSLGLVRVVGGGLLKVLRRGK